MRILIATPGATDARGGAGQLAMRLCEGLRRVGHDAYVLDLSPPPVHLSPWRRRRLLLQSVIGHVKAAGPFDIVDVPPPLAPPGLRGGARLIVRSVQPELRYLAVQKRDATRRFIRGSLRAALSLVLLELQRAWVRQGWQTADLLFCLGNREFEWMQRNFAEGAATLRRYDAAPSDDDRNAFERVRSLRASRRQHGTRFLWLGRWSAHKGTEGLVRFANERLASQPGDLLTVAGCGALRPETWNATVRDRIHVLKGFERHEVSTLLAESDVGLFTSIAEGWGLSLQEMLESGMPVLATREGAVSELEPYFPGAIAPFPPGSPNSIPIGCAPAPGYASRFNWSTIASRYIDSIGDSVGRGGRK